MDIPSKDKTLVILVHGICGSPVQMQPFAQCLADCGAETVILTLPGHDGNTAAFCRSTASDWQAHVDEAVQAARRGHGRIYLLGHSLGALLSLDTAGRQPVDGVICIGAPLRPRTNLFQIRMGLRVMLGNPSSDDPIVRKYRESRGVSVRGPWDYIFWLPPFSRLLFLMHRIKLALSSVGCPVLVIQSSKDETVSRSSAERIARAVRGPARVLKLDRSRHAWIDPEEFPVLQEAMRSFVFPDVNVPV